MLETMCCGESTTNFNTTTGERNRCDGCALPVDSEGMPIGGFLTDDGVLDLTDCVSQPVSVDWRGR